MATPHLREGVPALGTRCRAPLMLLTGYPEMSSNTGDEGLTAPPIQSGADGLFDLPARRLVSDSTAVAPCNDGRPGRTPGNEEHQQRDQGDHSVPERRMFKCDVECEHPGGGGSLKTTPNL